MRGHEEASGTKYVPEDLMEYWANKDPLENYEEYLIDQKILTNKMTLLIEKKLVNEINEHLQIALMKKKLFQI